MDETIKKKVMLSGIKPTGDLTLGSYLGAIKNWAERADQYDCFMSQAPGYDPLVFRDDSSLLPEHGVLRCFFEQTLGHGRSQSQGDQKAGQQ